LTGRWVHLPERPPPSLVPPDYLWTQPPGPRVQPGPCQEHGNPPCSCAGSVTPAGLFDRHGRGGSSGPRPPPKLQDAPPLLHHTHPFPEASVQVSWLPQPTGPDLEKDQLTVTQKLIHKRSNFSCEPNCGSENKGNPCEFFITKVDISSLLYQSTDT